jgi:ferredoxin-NADP reductase
MYEIAVLHEEAGRCGRLPSMPRGRSGPDSHSIIRPISPLHDDERPAVLIAGGIGITPIKAMAQELKARGNPFELHYSGRTAADMAYRDRLAIEFRAAAPVFHALPGGTRIVLYSILRSAPADALFYVCGAGRLIEAGCTTARVLAIPGVRVQYESFE